MNFSSTEESKTKRNPEERKVVNQYMSQTDWMTVMHIMHMYNIA